jgi:tRNA A-37 threonylcarbamoyl transferase component Bud32
VRWRCEDAAGAPAPALLAALDAWPLLAELVRTPTVLVERRRDPAGGEVAIKRYRFPRLARRLEAAFRHTWLGASPKAHSETRALARLRALGVPAVEPLGWGAARDVCGFVRDSFLITRWWPHPDLARLLAERGPPPPEAWRALGASVAAMHARGVRHGGLAPRNVLVGAENGRWRVRWLDPARARFRHGRLESAVAERDLAALRPAVESAPAAARQAFEEGYCSPSFWSPAASAGSTSSASPTTP